MTSFVSYSKDYDRVAVLVAALRRHGLRPWRDQDSLGSGTATAAEIAEALATCDSCLLWLADATFDSDYVWDIEVPKAFDAHRRNDLRLVPLFVDVTPTEGIDMFRRKAGLEIGDFNGHVLAESENVAQFANRVAAAEAAAWLRRRAPGRRPVIRAVTRTDAAGARHDADLNFDWRREYPANGELPDEATVAELHQALHRTIAHVIAEFGSGTVDLHLSCHSHIAVALGFELRRVTGAVPRIAVGDEYWTCEITPPDGDSRLVEHAADGPATARRSAVEVCLSRSIERDVSAFIAEHDVPYRRRIHFEPRGKPGQTAVTAATVNPWADQVADAIREARGQAGVEDIDLFIAAPVGFAVALGWRLNAVGGVNIFHLDGNAGPYRLAWTLPRT